MRNYPAVSNKTKISDINEKTVYRLQETKTLQKVQRRQNSTVE